MRIRLPRLRRTCSQSFSDPATSYAPHTHPLPGLGAELSLVIFVLAFLLFSSMLSCQPPLLRMLWPFIPLCVYAYTLYFDHATCIKCLIHVFYLFFCPPPHPHYEPRHTIRFTFPRRGRFTVLLAAVFRAIRVLRSAAMVIRSLSLSVYHSLTAALANVIYTSSFGMNLVLYGVACVCDVCPTNCFPR